jgi:hypothetical protein
MNNLTDEQLKALEKDFLRDGEFNFLNLKALSVAVIRNALKDEKVCPECEKDKDGNYYYQPFICGGEHYKDLTDDGKFWSLCYTETDKLQQNKGMTDSSESSPTTSPFDFADNTQYTTNFVTDKDILGF